MSRTVHVGRAAHSLRGESVGGERPRYLANNGADPKRLHSRTRPFVELHQLGCDDSLDRFDVHTHTLACSRNPHTWRCPNDRDSTLGVALKTACCLLVSAGGADARQRVRFAGAKPASPRSSESTSVAPV